jgi:hypothetical protein
MEENDETRLKNLLKEAFFRNEFKNTQKNIKIGIGANALV